jgi:Domain of unknown function (DUF6456)
MPQILVERPQSGGSRSVTVNLAESPLGWLKARRLVSDRQFAAGEQLRLDYERGGLPQRTTMAWDATPIAKMRQSAFDPVARTEKQILAKKRFIAATDHAGRGLSDILWRVICGGETVPTAENALGWPKRAGRLVLTMALDRVADYYRMV